MLQEFRMVSVASYLHFHFPQIYKSKGEIRRLLQQKGITLWHWPTRNNEVIEWTPTSGTAGIVFDSENYVVGTFDDQKEFIEINKINLELSRK